MRPSQRFRIYLKGNYILIGTISTFQIGIRAKNDKLFRLDLFNFWLKWIFPHFQNFLFSMVQTTRIGKRE